MSVTPRYSFRYNERISLLSHNGKIYAFQIVLIAQFIYFNLRYVIGATLTLVAMGSIVGQIILGAIETNLLEKYDKKRLEYTLRVHYIFNDVINAIYLPFLLWTVVLMYQDARLS